MFILVCTITYQCLNSKRKSSTFLTYSLKIFSLYALLLNTIITIPFFNIFLATLYCQKDSPVHPNTSCYSGLYFLHIASAIIGMILMLIFCFMFTLLYIDLNPNSSIPFASPQSKINLFRLAIKFILPLYFTLDYSVNIFLIIVCL